MSGASQVALTTMRPTQAALARMESTQAVQGESLRQAVQALQEEAALSAQHTYRAEYAQESHREAEAAAGRTAQEEEIKKAPDEQAPTLRTTDQVAGRSTPPGPDDYSVPREHSDNSLAQHSDDIDTHSR
ncbi:uncharacterized protein IUM83_19870 [Phytophthora cinnamomi]|uniref:uncharacterized protein n=1 Tax=Phytophthora cinnamomi TaxID=4785 RepID=UPI00355A8268|nr:hypothetical protein IUM83_19870 [Phytophthora cinnamomi]